MKKINFDGAWKESIFYFFPPFMAFFMPDLHFDIDYTIQYEFLEQELRDIQKDIPQMKRVTDKLIKVWLKNGEERWIFIHVEIQGKQDPNFSLRMYMYYNLIFSRYGHRITALAISTSSTTPTNFGVYILSLYGTELRYKYNTYEIAAQDEQTLIDSDNIFALFVLANYYTIKTRSCKDNQQKRLDYKKKLYELAWERNIPVQVIDKLLIFVHEIMKLDLSFEMQFESFTKSKEKKMSASVLTSKSSKRFINNMMNNFMEGMYGKTLDDFIKEKETISKEKETISKEIETISKEKETISREKETISKEKEMQLRKAIKGFVALNLSAQQIANILEIPYGDIEKIIKEISNK